MYISNIYLFIIHWYFKYTSDSLKRNDVKKLCLGQATEDINEWLFTPTGCQVSGGGCMGWACRMTYAGACIGYTPLRVQPPANRQPDSQLPVLVKRYWWITSWSPLRSAWAVYSTYLHVSIIPSEFNLNCCMILLRKKIKHSTQIKYSFRHGFNMIINMEMSTNILTLKTYFYSEWHHSGQNEGGTGATQIKKNQSFQRTLRKLLLILGFS